MEEITKLESFDWCLIGKVLTAAAVIIGFVWIIKRLRISLSWIINRLLGLKFGQQAITVTAVLTACFLILLSPAYKDWLSRQSYFSLLLCVPLLSCLLSLRLLAGVAGRPYKPRVWTHKLLGCIMYCVWSMGWVVMFFTYYVIITKTDAPVYNGTELLVKSAFGATKLFAMDAGATLYKQIEEYELLRDTIAFLSLAGFACMMALLVSLLFSRLGAWLRLRNLQTRKGDSLYVFFGYSTASELLIKSLGKDAVCVVVETNQMHRDDESTSSWGNFKKAITHRRRTFDNVCRRTHALLSIADRPIGSISPEHPLDGSEDILRRAGLEHLSAVIRRMPEGAGLHLFFLNDDERENVKCLLTMTHDSNLHQACATGVATCIYCLARYESINRVVEDQRMPSGMRVSIVDASHLAVESLREDDDNLPASFVALSEEKPGAAEAADGFTCMAVGLSETGCDAVRFLYEHSALLDAASDDRQPRRIPLHCHLVDPQLRARGGSFLSGMPAAMKNSNADGSPLIETHCLSARSVEFHEQVLEPIASQLNYVVIATGTDEGSIELAADIMHCVIKHNARLDRFRVLVRVYDDHQKARLQAIADHYNQTTGRKWLQLFGLPEAIFTYDMIVRNRYEGDAIRFYDSYREARGDNPRTTWQDRIDLAFGRQHIVVADRLAGEALSRYRRGEAVGMQDVRLAYEPCTGQPRYKDLRRLRRQMQQDMSNACHVRTKRLIMQQAMPAGMTFTELNRRLKACGGNCSRLPQELQALMLRMAITEHLRWNASHEMLGYTPRIEDGRCDEIAMTHNCLVPWEQLPEADRYAESTYTDEFPFSRQMQPADGAEKVKVAVHYKPDFRSYDYAVVQTTIALLAKEEEELTNQKP